MNKKIILTASFRYRLLSETRVAVCLILDPGFVLWLEGAPEGSDRSTRLRWMAKWVIFALFFIPVFRRMLVR